MSQENVNQVELTDDLMNAYLTGSSKPTVVKAEDIENEGSGIDYARIFFEPKPGKTYTIKFIQNGNQGDLVHRKIYKKLPHPERRGKSFHYISSNNSNTCKALELFFELHEKKKNGDVLAEQKIEKFLGQTNQGCSIIEIISSDDEDFKAGMFRLFSFSTYGPNASLANMIDVKLNPSEQKLAAGVKKEEIYDIFDSIVLMIVCKESTLPDGTKGRDFAQSEWLPTRMGASVTLDDGQKFQFKAEHKTPTGIAPEAIPAFRKLIEITTSPDLSIHNYFAYKTVGDPKNSEETEKYLVKVNEYVDKVIPVIRNAKSIQEILDFCKADNSSTSTEGESKPENILATSLPTELAGSILENGDAKVETSSNVKQTPTNVSEASSEAASILGMG